jgi:hypothetical protein
MALQFYTFSKNDAKKNPVEDFQRDVDNLKGYHWEVDRDYFLPAAETESNGVWCLVKAFVPHAVHCIAAI